ncbi:hypothetical protein E8E11_000208 [Didymella keratinophila]|nr:hypothetical protein E8E11_000208 [Didymella keratinophila]
MYTRTGSLEALDTAIEVGQEVLKTTSKNYPIRPGRLNNLSIQLRYRHAQTRETNYSGESECVDLNECIKHLREAVGIVGSKYPDRAQWLNSLGVSVGDKYEVTKDISVLEEAIKIMQEAVATLPRHHADWAAYLNTLGDRLANRYSATETADDLSAITSSYQSALYHSNSALLHRITAGRKVLKYHAVKLDWQQAFQDASAAVELIQKLTERALGNSDKQYMLGQIVGLASDAAAVALNAEQGPLVALRLLEQGRGVLAAFLGEMRTDISDLQTIHPHLATEFKRLRDVLDTPATKQSFPDQEGGPPISEDIATMRSRAGIDFDNLLAEIRQQSGFEDFLLPPTEEELKVAGNLDSGEIRYPNKVIEEVQRS